MRLKTKYLCIEFYDSSQVSEEIKNFCIDYWDCYTTNKDTVRFRKPNRELADKYGFKNTSMPTKTIKKHCFAYPKPDYNLICENCGSEIILTVYKDRSDLLCNNKFLIFPFHRNKTLCSDCEREQKRQEKIREEEIAWGEYYRKIERHNESIRNGVYETLDKLEFNYLVSLAESENNIKAGKKVGLSEDNSIKVFKKLESIDLVVVSPENYFYMDNEFKQSLINIGYRRKTKPLLNSKPVQELYKKLKKEYLFVYPEISLSAIIDSNSISNILDEKWKYYYFLSCRLDFLITDEDSNSKFGVEFQGGYHEDEEQKVKDRLKREIMNEVGLEISYMTNKDLN